MLPFRNKLSYKQNLAASVLSELTTVCTLFSHPGMPFSRERWVVVAVSSFYFLKLKWRLATSNISIVPLRSLTAGLDRIVYVHPFLWNITALIQEIFSSFRAVRYSCKIPSPISGFISPIQLCLFSFDEHFSWQNRPTEGAKWFWFQCHAYP